MKSSIDNAIEEFVRGPLGCNCPPQVFDVIENIGSPVDFQNLPATQLIKIGGILLVLIMQVDDWKPLQFKLESIFKQGIDVRDTIRFNRFRLVIATPDAKNAAKALNKNFKKFLHIDEKIHLHVITPEELPDYISQS